MSDLSLYTHLPEPLVHRTKPKYTYQTKTEESVAEIKRHRDEEKAARKFFQPLDEEFANLKQRILEEELALTGPAPSKQQIRILARFWGISHLPLNELQLTFLLRLLPLAKNMVGQWPQVALCLETLLGVPVTITPADYHRTIKLDVPLPALGESVLGVDTLLGAYAWEEEPFVQVTIGPVPYSFFIKWSQKGDNYRIFSKVTGYLFPKETPIEIKIALQQSTNGFILGQNIKQIPSVLGHNTSI